MRKYNNTTDKYEFKTLEEAVQKKNQINSQYMQVVICPVTKYGKEVYKVSANFKLV